MRCACKHHRRRMLLEMSWELGWEGLIVLNCVGFSIPGGRGRLHAGGPARKCLWGGPWMIGGQRVSAGDERWCRGS